MKVPKAMQGRAFLGPQKQPEPDYMHLFRDRMDERVDFCRAVTDGTYRYIFNFYPERPQAQYIEYMYRNPTLKRWKELADGGTLPPHQTAFFRAKPVEELYDLAADPDEVKNLANEPGQAKRVAAMRKAMVEHMVRIRDLGVYPEPLLHARAAGTTPYEAGQATAEGDYRRVLGIAIDAALGADEKTVSKWLQDKEPAVRYRGVLAVGRSHANSKVLLKQVAGLVSDEEIPTAIAAAERVVASGAGDVNGALALLERELGNAEAMIALRAANSIDRLDDKAKRVLPAVRRLIEEHQKGYPAGVCKKILLDQTGN